MVQVVLGVDWAKCLQAMAALIKWRRICQKLGCSMYRTVFSLLLLIVGAASALAAEQTDTSYRLGSGDKVNITVYGEDDLSIETPLGQSGIINYPYLGEIKAAGLTVAELEKRLTDGLRGDYLVNPSVHVSILEYRPFYIYGQVFKPGGYPFQPNLTVERAVALGGGFTERAERREFKIRRSDNGKETELKGSLDTVLLPGDSVFVTESFF